MPLRCHHQTSPSSPKAFPGKPCCARRAAGSRGAAPEQDRQVATSCREHFSGLEIKGETVRQLSQINVRIVLPCMVGPVLLVWLPGCAVTRFPALPASLWKRKLGMAACWSSFTLFPAAVLGVCWSADVWVCACVYDCVFVSRGLRDLCNELSAARV